jgi:D-lactate dehydrogenase (cytochrome)
MNRVLEVAADDFLAVVQPAVTYPQLNRSLRASGLFFPVDPGAEASLGGMASTNASGTLAVRYGVTRDHIRGLEVVTPTGQVIRTGGRAPKSSSGYSLTQLFCGAEGTLGVITELTVRLVPRPESAVGARVAFGDIPSAVGYVTELIQAGMPVARCELVDGAGLRAIREHLGLTLPETPTVFLEFHGEPATARSACENAVALAREHGSPVADMATDPAALEALWRARHQAYNAAVAVHPGLTNVITDVAVPVSRLAEVIETALASIERVGVASILIGHAGDGNFHLVLFFPPNDADARRRVETAYDELVRAALAAGGTCTGEHGVGLRKLPYVREEHGAAVDVMWAIKDALDPAGIMNPGKKLPQRTY